MSGGLAAGQLVDERYTLEVPLERSEPAVVWRAHDRGLGRAVCLREVRYPGEFDADPGSRRRRALDAARAAIRLNHPGAVTVYDALLDGERLVVVTELVEAPSLAQKVSGGKRLSPKRAAGIGLDVLGALTAAQAQGLVHRGVAPDVVLLPHKAPARLAGFGLAPSFDDPASLGWLATEGTPSCVAPEQARHLGDGPASDLWALGATLYFAVEGHHAFSGSTPEATLQSILEDPVPPPRRAGALGPLLEQLLAKDPSARPSAEEVKRQLAEVAGMRPVQEVVAAAPAPASPRARKRRGGRRRGDEADQEQTASADPDLAEEAKEAGAGADTSSHETSDRMWDAVVAGTTAATTTTPDADPSPSVAPEYSWGPEPEEAVSETDGASDGAPIPVHAATAPAQEAPPAPPAVPEAEGEDGPPRYRPFPSWPPPPKPRITISLICVLVVVVLVALLVTNGYIGTRSDTEQAAEQRPALRTDPQAVPRDWIAYRNPRVNYGISHPPSWQVREDGPVVRVREPVSGAELRIEYRSRPDAPPERAWTDRERTLAAEHPDYRRLQLSPATYLDQPAGLWEYTYSEGNVVVHAVDLGFDAKGRRFTLHFQAPASTWSDMLPVFSSFLNAFRLPK